MPNFFNLPSFAEDGAVNVVVETPRGSRAKFAFDPKLESLHADKVPSGRFDVSPRLGLCPFDYGRRRRSARCYGHSRRGDLPGTGAGLPHHRHSPDPAEK